MVFQVMGQQSVLGVGVGYMWRRLRGGEYHPPNLP